ncbi:Alpha/Beta hydrolase protein [Lipomyces tetrasporus]|uniref:Alpha/Beta hydrolase protein n=1 Tax=Lipomyces tetrasporus TaxID=54092 RepID=A0AAD7VVP2_9ASCO|nr:Alpha/Beta hydrolase protein [Lipomyces tetrasporus]KAJ8103703.1 Alpha/Beta hydrolase protein [Lipomyces tetrasporus]
MDTPLSTSDVPKQFLKACSMVGHVPLKALTCDPRVSYALYIPPTRYDADPNPTKLPLLVWVHGTGRKWNTLYEDDMLSFADRMPCAILAPLFPAGLSGPNDLDSYKMLHSSSLRSDQAMLGILDEVAARWPGIRTDKFFVMGFSGGGQFAQRFLYLYPERLAAISVGAPGRVTALDFSKDWPAGVANTKTLFDREVVPDNIRKVAIQLVVGSEDNKVHGGEAFWSWLENFQKERVEKQSETSGLSRMENGRLQTLEELHRSWRTDEIDSQLNIVSGIAHEAGKARPYMLRFLEPLIQADI